MRFYKFCTFFCVIWIFILCCNVYVHNTQIKDLKLKTQYLEERLEIEEKRGNRLEIKVNLLTKKIVKVTAYTGAESENDSDPHLTACMTKPRLGTIAVSQDLFKQGWTCGRTVDISGIGLVIINDKMHYRKRNQLDLFIPSKKSALKFGVKRGLIAVLTNLS